LIVNSVKKEGVVMGDLEYSLNRFNDFVARRISNALTEDSASDDAVYKVFREVIESGYSVWLIDESCIRVAVIRLNDQGEYIAEDIPF
jgi:hypothetical protein